MWGRIQKCATKAVTDRETKTPNSLEIKAGYKYNAW
jgi:acyl-CoA-binding protein